MCYSALIVILGTRDRELAIEQVILKKVSCGIQTGYLAAVPCEIS